MVYSMTQYTDFTTAFLTFKTSCNLMVHPRPDYGVKIWCY